MWFDVPILSYKSPEAEKIVGDAGILLSNKDDLLSVAVLAQMVATDRTLRDKIVAAQRIARGRHKARGPNASASDVDLESSIRRMALERL